MITHKEFYEPNVAFYIPLYVSLMTLSIYSIFEYPYMHLVLLTYSLGI